MDRPKRKTKPLPFADLKTPARPRIVIVPTRIEFYRKSIRCAVGCLKDDLARARNRLDEIERLVKHAP